MGLGFKRGDMPNLNPTLQVLASSYPYQIPKVHIYSTSLFFFLSLFLLLILPYPVSLSSLPFFFFHFPSYHLFFFFGLYFGGVFFFSFVLFYLLILGFGLFYCVWNTSGEVRNFVVSHLHVEFEVSFVFVKVTHFS